MAFYTVRVNLNAAQFPLLSELSGRTIIISGADENYDRAVISTSGDADKDKGIPQVLYLHNVLPTANGFQSISYDQLIEPRPVMSTNFGPIFQIQTENLGRILLCPAGGVNYIFDRTVSDDWNTNSSFSVGTVPDNVQVTIAFVKGITYIYYANYGCFRYDDVAKILVPVTLTAVVPADVIAILSSSGYMVALTRTGVVWSSLIDPTDFTPDITTGAGGGNLAEADGKINIGFSMSGGFIVYCDNNAVSGRITSNTDFPFAFNQIPGAGGVVSGEAVSWQSNVADHFAWTNAGLQQINLAGSKFVLPEFSDFLSSLVLEDFDEVTNSLSQINLPIIMQVAVAVIGLRYVVLSYGPNYPDYDFAIVYDTVLKRNGKLKITHRDCFQWNFPNVYGETTYDGLGTLTYDDLGFETTYDDLNIGVDIPDNERESFAFVKANGEVVRVNFTLDRDASDGVFILGKYQYVRNLFLTHLDTDVEVVNSSANNFQAFLIPSLNGKDLLPAVGMFAVPARPGSKLRSFKREVTALNISILLRGAFNLTSELIRFTTAGIS